MAHQGAEGGVFDSVGLDDFLLLVRNYGVRHEHVGVPLLGFGFGDVDDSDEVDALAIDLVEIVEEGFDFDAAGAAVFDEHDELRLLVLGIGDFDFFAKGSGALKLWGVFQLSLGGELVHLRGDGVAGFGADDGFVHDHGPGAEVGHEGASGSEGAGRREKQELDRHLLIMICFPAGIWAR